MLRAFSIFLLSALLISFTPAGEDPVKAALQHQSDLFREVFRTVNENFVDSLDATKLARVAIDAMMHSLDPYSVYFDDRQTQDREKVWRGQLYAGIGAGVAPRDSQVIITDPYEGYGADLSGLRIGDRIYAVNGERVNGKSFDEVVSKLRGEPGTEVEVTVERGEGKLITKRITRKQIFTKSILYTGFIDKETGYINVSQFLKGSDSEFRKIVTDLKSGGAKYLVLDLRDNIGGLVQEAVNCLACFFPKRTRVCELKGAHPNGNFIYYTDQDPIDTLMPIAVLTNNVTVSSGEIFTGAMQDLDRAVVIGERTFGKGFVQGTRYPGFGTSIYLTVARYYTPSGRCIQELDYSKKYTDNKVTRLPDSLKHEYKTRHERKVYNIGGIDPDLKMAGSSGNKLFSGIRNSAFYMDYLTSYRNANEAMIEPGSFSLSEASRKDFLKKLFASSVINEIKLPSEDDLEVFEKSAKNDGATISISGEVNAIRKRMVGFKKDHFRSNQSAFFELMEKDIVRRYLNQSGTFRYMLARDPQIKVAITTIKDKEKLKTILNLN